LALRRKQVTIGGVAGTVDDAYEVAPAPERLIAPVRRHGIRSFLIAVSIVGVIAGILSASNMTLEGKRAPTRLVLVSW
jgi:hypothetical protein